MKTTLSLNVPRQRHPELTYCEPTPDAMREWVASLPVTNVIETAMQLYKAIMELNQLQTFPEQRFAMLEELRGTIHAQCTSLSRIFLQGPLVLSRRAQQLADLVQALQNQLAMGYKIVVADGVQARIRLGLDPRPRPQTMAGALHRAISDLTRGILRSCQLYTQPPREIWLELHQLYRFAEIKQMLDQEVADPENELMEFTTISNAYLRAALLGCTKANTMRRDDLTHLFHALEIWASHTSMGLADEDSLFLVDLSADAPPFYRALHQGESLETCRSLKTRALVECLDDYLNDAEPGVPIPDVISPQVVRHAVHSWSALARRAFTRAPASGELEVCVGMSCAHYHVAGEMDFAELLGEDAAEVLNPFLRFSAGHTLTQLDQDADRDIWSEAFEVEGSASRTNPRIRDTVRAPREPGSASVHPSFTTELVDTGPGGCCVRWPKEVPTNLQAGELLAVREEPDHEWAVAVVRWIRDIRAEGTLMGIEFLAPRAIAVGARVIRKKGGATDYLRALLLPELQAIRQPAMLITPRLPFKTRQKIQLSQAGQELTAQITENVGSADDFCQFRFRFLDATPKVDENEEDSFQGLDIEF